MQDDIPGSFDPASDLDPAEIRVLGVLAEKEALTPDNYPLTLNAIMNGCNQLSSRDPVMQLAEDVVHDTLPRPARASSSTSTACASSGRSSRTSWPCWRC
jgi:uncharacterized protein YceH (UPF0502 family)